MAVATITFQKCIQDSQEYGSNDEYMISRVFFSMDYAGKNYQELSVDLKQTVGSSFDESMIEVSAPHGYDGPFNQNAFRDEVVGYYGDLIGSSGSGIKIAGSSKNIRMRNNTFLKTKVVIIEIA